MMEWEKTSANRRGVLPLWSALVRVAGLSVSAVYKHKKLLPIHTQINRTEVFQLIEIM